AGRSAGRRSDVGWLLARLAAPAPAALPAPCDLGGGNADLRRRADDRHALVAAAARDAARTLPAGGVGTGGDAAAARVRADRGHCLARRRGTSWCPLAVEHRPGAADGTVLGRDRDGRCRRL